MSVEEENKDATQLLAALADFKSCAICSPPYDKSKPFVEFCDCQVKNYHVHLECIRNLQITDAGFLKCPNDKCDCYFNQYTNGQQFSVQSRQSFNRKFKMSLVGIFVDIFFLQLQLFFLYNLTSFDNVELILALVGHIVSVFAHATTMTLLAGNTAENLFLRYFDKQDALNAIHVSIVAVLGLSIFSLLPLLAIRKIYVFYSGAAAWLLVYCTCVIPAMAWFVFKENFESRRRLHNTIYELRKADVYSLRPSNFNSQVW